MRAIIFIEARGKVPAWTRISASLGIDARVVSTDGHLCDFPDRLHPLGIRLEDDRALDRARGPRPDALARVRRAVMGRREGTDILIATDDDPEGDAIALDVLNAVVKTDPALAGACLRVRPGAIDRETVRSAIAGAYGEGCRPDAFVAEAAAGRTRALADRWIGAAFSRMARASCGRVRAGILGAALGWSRASDQADGLPETGEITFQARSDAGGPPFTAHLQLRGRIPRTLAAVAERHAGRLVPGHVSPASPAGAAVAPRFGDVAPFNTGDALVHAARFHGVGPRAAMAGLQDAYMKGLISYPRTDNRTISRAAATEATIAARICGLLDADMRHGAKHAHPESPSGRTVHEAIHPTAELARSDTGRLRRLTLAPVGRVDPDDACAVEELMIALVARRCFEALRQDARARGIFHPRERGDLSAEEGEALADLEWTRPEGRILPWNRAGATGLRIWPMASVIVEGMMIERIGRPSTWARHADLVERSGQLSISAPGALPAPSPEGLRALMAIPSGMRGPNACRTIEAALERPAPVEEDGMELARRMRARTDVWLTEIDPEARDVLLEFLASAATGEDMRATATPEATRSDQATAAPSAKAFGSVAFCGQSGSAPAEHVANAKRPALPGILALESAYEGPKSPMSVDGGRKSSLAVDGRRNPPKAAEEKREIAESPESTRGSAATEIRSTFASAKHADLETKAALSGLPASVRDIGTRSFPEATDAYQEDAVSSQGDYGQDDAGTRSTATPEEQGEPTAKAALPRFSASVRDDGSPSVPEAAGAYPEEAAPSRQASGPVDSRSLSSATPEEQAEQTAKIALPSFPASIRGNGSTSVTEAPDAYPEEAAPSRGTSGPDVAARRSATAPEEQAEPTAKAGMPGFPVSVHGDGSWSFPEASEANTADEASSQAACGSDAVNSRSSAATEKDAGQSAKGTLPGLPASVPGHGSWSFPEAAETDPADSIPSQGDSGPDATGNRSTAAVDEQDELTAKAALPDFPASVRDDGTRSFPEATDAYQEDTASS